MASTSWREEKHISARANDRAWGNLVDILSTHEIFNQPPPFVDVNLAALDAPLMSAVAVFGAPDDREALFAHGAAMGTAAMLDLARLANENPPKLKPYDPRGGRIDFVEFHPAYHELMRASVGAGLASSTWDRAAPEATRPAGHGHVARSAMHFITAGIKDGHLCPVTMTHAAVAALAAAPDHLAKLLPLIRSRRYDPSFRPFWEKNAPRSAWG